MKKKYTWQGQWKPRATIRRRHTLHRITHAKYFIIFYLTEASTEVEWGIKVKNASLNSLYLLSASLRSEKGGETEKKA